MCEMDSKHHWESVYRAKHATEMSWFQREARLSLELISEVAPDRAASILDAGGGASTLVDGLLRAGYGNVTVLDISAAALKEARARVGIAANVIWQQENLLEAPLPEAAFDVWHDRAVFHFLTDARDRRRYVDQVQRAVRPGGHVIVATFAHDGPTRCSGLDVVRYTPDALHAEFGASFHLLRSAREEHTTPSGSTQAFVYIVCRHDPARGLKGV